MRRVQIRTRWNPLLNLNLEKPPFNPLEPIQIFGRRLAMDELLRIPNDKIDISEIHRLTVYIEPESSAYRQAQSISSVSLIITQNMLEVMRDDIDKVEIRTFLCPKLAIVARLPAILLGETINGMIDRDACEKRQPR